MPSRAPRKIECIARGLAVREGKVLLCRNVEHGLAYLPGGHVDPGETAAEALAREFAEECGLRVEVGAFLLANEHLFTQQGTPRHEWNAVFHVEHSGGVWPESVPSLETDLAFEWCEVAGLPEAGFVPTPLLAWLLAGGPDTVTTPAEAWVSHVEPD
ncbi:MAG: NUDIX domain-containing protein [Phycisphaerales bacterium JB041]